MNAAAPTQTETPAPGRLMSLDVFRGATIAAMVLVNNPGNWGAIYRPLDHAEWHGWTFTDLIFPFFIWIAGLLGGYWVMMIVGPWFGWGSGDLEPQSNFSQYIDNLVLNGKVIGTHVWKGGKTWDPEGVFSTVPAIATCLFGIMTGHLIRSKQTPETKTAWLFVGANLLLFAGVVMDVWLPINKKLWTSTYSVFMAGMAMNCFGVCYWLVDVQGWRKWAKPFAIYGINAIAVFMMAGMLGRILPTIQVATAAGKKVGLQSYLYDNLFAPFASADTAPFCGFLASPKNASLMWALTYVLGLYLVAYGIYRRKWFLKF